MIDLSKKNIVKLANETNFIKDNIEKVMRLIDILEIIYSSEWKEKFILKGGTAINLFYANMPRLSVDIDLDYSIESRDEMIKDKDLFYEYISAVLSQKGYSLSASTKRYFALDSYVIQYTNNAGNKDNIKIEINYLDRIHILAPKVVKISALNYSSDVNILTLDCKELYGSKLAALLSRSKPRDVFDVDYAINAGIIKNDDILRKCLVFYNCIGGEGDIVNKDYSKIDMLKKRDFDLALKPVLPKTLLFKEKSAIININKFLNDLLIFKDEETKFVEQFKEGKYMPEYLFNNEIADRIKNHPMALWRCSNI